LPESTYTLSFKLGDEAGYWDPAVISEDWHIYLRCFFVTEGQVSLKRIFLPFSSSAVDGATLWQAIANYYQQKRRHAWGAEDVGYILQQWNQAPDVPTWRKALCLSRVGFFHLLWSTSWFLLVQGWLVALRFQFYPEQPLVLDPVLTGPFRNFGVVWTAGSAVAWLLERVRCQPGWRDWHPAKVASELVAWLTWPFTGLGLFALPALHAQTRLLLGSQLAYGRTPKMAVEGEE
jgi:hypothetical protein